MNRRSLYKNQIPMLEDILIQQKYIMKVVSSAMAGYVGGEVMSAPHWGVYLPGPYDASTPGFFTVNSIGATTDLAAQFPSSLTIKAPLGLVQALNPDPSSWSTLPADPSLYYIIGQLAADQVFDFSSEITIPPPGPSTVNLRYATIYGSVAVVDSSNEGTLFYNPSDPTNPVTIQKSRNRSGVLTLGVVFGTTVANNNPPLPTVPSGSAPLMNVLLAAGNAVGVVVISPTPNDDTLLGPQISNKHLTQRVIQKGLTTGSVGSVQINPLSASTVKLIPQVPISTQTTFDLMLGERAFIDVTLNLNVGQILADPPAAMTPARQVIATLRNGNTQLDKLYVGFVIPAGIGFSPVVGIKLSHIQFGPVKDYTVDVGLQLAELGAWMIDWSHVDIQYGRIYTTIF